MIVLVDDGCSFQNARELYELLVKHPLNHSEFHLFQPIRDLVQWNVSNHVSKLRQYYLLEYNIDQRSTVGRIHSRHSYGTTLKNLHNESLGNHGRNSSCKSEDNFGNMKVADLKAALKQVGLCQGGKRLSFRNASKSTARSS